MTEQLLEIIYRTEYCPGIFDRHVNIEDLINVERSMKVKREVGVIILQSNQSII